MISWVLLLQPQDQRQDHSCAPAATAGISVNSDPGSSTTWMPQLIVPQHQRGLTEGGGILWQPIGAAWHKVYFGIKKAPIGVCQW